MKIRFRLKKSSSSLVTMLACALFVWLAIARLGLSKEKAVEWLIIIVVSLLLLIVLAAISGLLIRWLMGIRK